jgi:hypothetical protein
VHEQQEQVEQQQEPLDEVLDEGLKQVDGVWVDS